MASTYGYAPKTNIVSKYWKDKYEKEADKYWNKFYKSNKTNFFKDRHWLFREFYELAPPELLNQTDGTNNEIPLNKSTSTTTATVGENTKSSSISKVKVMEVGCGVGNTVFPLLEGNPDLFIYAFDFAPTAVQLVKENANYKTESVCAFVCDIVKQELPSFVEVNSLDFVILIFVLSAISPENMLAVLKKLYRALKPGGKLLFRDYAVNDMAQQRFEEERRDKEPNKLQDNFYVRGDGTRAYYFSVGMLGDNSCVTLLEFLGEMCTSVGFDIDQNDYVHRDVENKKQELELNRVFLQAKFVKKESNQNETQE